ncbi:MAG TPA: OB-fold nucleic acid binding domain-containing protein, partial [Casimicrobiaceae bacterium]
LKHYEPAAFCGALLNSQPMGFYAPAQLVADARRHDVDVRAVDVTISDWDCTLENGALRLGLCMVKGLTEAGAKRIVEARRSGPFTSVADLAQRAKVDRRDLAALADADALIALSGHRHDAVWEVAGVERLPEVLEGATFDETPPALAAPSEGQDIVADYRRLGLTLRRHPLALLRGQLRAKRMMTSEDVARTPHGRLARVAGIVIGRQRPDTRSGVVFVTLEDETGATNVIVWRDVGDRQRRELLGSRLMAVYGKIEREGEVVHVIAGRLVDMTPLLGSLPTKSRDFH